jgi:hypothetical protein
MKKKPLRLTISFSKEFEDVYNFLNEKENSSKYICEVIRREMKSDKKGDDFEGKVYEVLLKIIEKENLQLSSKTVPKSPSQTKTALSNDEIDLMNDLFG